MNKPINQENLNATLRFLEKQGEAALEELKVTDPQLAECGETLKLLFSDENFCKAFFSCPDRQSAVQLFGDNGIIITEAEVEGLVLQLYTMVKRLEENDGELSEEELAQIAGGSLFSTLGKGLGIALIAGFLAASTIASIFTGGLAVAGISVAVGALCGGVSIACDLT